MSFFSRTLGALKRMLWKEEVKPPPPHLNIPPEIHGEYGGRPIVIVEGGKPPGGGKREPTDVSYLEGRDKIYPRWTIGDGEHPLSLEEVRRLLNHIPPKRSYTVVVHGISPFNISEYFSYDEAWISYIFDRKDMTFLAFDPDIDTGTGWINELIKEKDYYWEEVWDIQIIDQERE